MQNDEKIKKPGVFRSPLAITGIMLLACALLLGILALVLKAEPTHMFYSVLSTGLGFLAINPLMLRIRNSRLWQWIIIGTTVAGQAWLFL